MTGMTELTRNEEICRLYKEGLTIYDLGESFNLSHERVRQIIRKAGIFKGDRKVTLSDRVEFLGVNLTEEAKAKVKRIAEARGISMSELTAGLIDEMIAAVEQTAPAEAVKE